MKYAKPELEYVFLLDINTDNDAINTSPVDNPTVDDGVNGDGNVELGG